MEKSAEAFRTISEVAEILDTPAHVLRFWESRFPQIRPVKRAGGRRYYRPADVALLAGIRRLLHDEGMTIRGVQKILREQGVRHVASLSGRDPGPAPDDGIDEGRDSGTGFAFGEPAEPRGEVVPFARDLPRSAEPPPPLRAEALPRPPSAMVERPAPADAAGRPGPPDTTDRRPGLDIHAGDAPHSGDEAPPPAEHRDMAIPTAALREGPGDALPEPPAGGSGAAAPPHDIPAPSDRADRPSGGPPPLWSAPAPLAPPTAAPAPLVPQAAVPGTAGSGDRAPVSMAGSAPPPAAAADPVPETAAMPQGTDAGLDLPETGSIHGSPPEASRRGSPAPEEPAATDEPDPQDAAVWHPALLRALPRGALADRRAEVARLRNRLLALRDRLRAGAPEPRG